jgi:hypothetical protein
MRRNSVSDAPFERNLGVLLLTSPEIEELRHTTPSRLVYHTSVSGRSGRLRLSQKVGILLWLNDHELLDEFGGARRLLRLQRQASFEALVAALKFRERLHSTPKMQRDFFHHAVLLNSYTPGASDYFRPEQRRIGVGYRDKGTLPEPSNSARKRADSSVWFFVEDIGVELADGFPREGDWVDLSEILAREDLDD